MRKRKKKKKKKRITNPTMNKQKNLLWVPILFKTKINKLPVISMMIKIKFWVKNKN
jgi:hypothetical protein